MPFAALSLLSACWILSQPSAGVPFLKVGAPTPPALDLKNADPQSLVPKNDLNEAEIETIRLAWAKIIQPYINETIIQIKLPNNDERLVLLQAACQALKAQNPAIAIYLAYDENAPPSWDENFWGPLDGGALAPEDLPGGPETWMDTFIKALSQLPARPWTIWCPSDPGAETSLLLGSGALLVVPPGGPTAVLANSILNGMDVMEGRRGQLTLKSQSTSREVHWQFSNSAWRIAAQEEERTTVVVEGKADYDVQALLARVRATQLRDSAALLTQESKLTINIHAQTGRGMGGDLGYEFSSFEKAGEPEEFLQERVLLNGVRANLAGELQLPII
jgi:hypothetical protein